MAECVEQRVEDMIDELEQMEKLKLFEKPEIKTIAKKRKDFEFKLQRQTKNKEDVLRYIQFEMTMMKMVRIRRQQRQLPAKKLNIEYSIANRVNRLFNEAIRRFSGDVRIWISYIKFCKQVKFYTSASRVFTQMLELHGDKPNLFKFAANWELEECQNIEKARKFLLNGLHIHKDSKVLFSEAFRLELIYAKMRKAEAEKQNMDTADPVFEGRLAEIVYDSAVKKVHNAAFMVELLELAKPYPLSANLQNKIIADMRTMYPNDELTWDTVAKHTLLGYQKKKLSSKERIRRCLKVYKMATKKLDTERMWSMYLDTLLELQKDGVYPVLKKKSLSNAFIAAHDAKQLPEKYYLIWIEQLKKDIEKSKKQVVKVEMMQVDEPEKMDILPEDAKKAAGNNKTSVAQMSADKPKKRATGIGQKNPKELLKLVLQESTERLGTSLALWEIRIRIHLSWDEEEKCLVIFKDANKALGAEALPLWKLMLLYWQTKDGNKVEDLLKEGTHPSQDPKIANPLKVLWLERVAVTKGILAARRLYWLISRTPPSSLELHTKMTTLENQLPDLNLKNIRHVYMHACTQFGAFNTDVWMDYIKFEKAHGQASNIQDIYFKAIRTLNKSAVDVFKSEFNLEKSNPGQTYY